MNKPQHKITKQRNTFDGALHRDKTVSHARRLILACLELDTQQYRRTICSNVSVSFVFRSPQIQQNLNSSACGSFCRGRTSAGRTGTPNDCHIRLLNGSLGTSFLVLGIYQNYLFIFRACKTSRMKDHCWEGANSSPLFPRGLSLVKN